MLKIEKKVDLYLELLNRLINTDIASVKYIERLKEFHVSIKGVDHYALCICEEEDNEESKDERLQIEIHSEKGFYNFFKIFPSVEEIDYMKNQKILEKFRFINSFIAGYDFQQTVINIENYKYYFRYDGDNYKFISAVGVDDKRYNEKEVEKVTFEYRYYINLLKSKIDIETSVIFSNLSFTKNSYNCFNNDEDINNELIGILNEFAANKLNKTIKELKLSDSVILQMMNY